MKKRNCSVRKNSLSIYRFSKNASNETYTNDYVRSKLHVETEFEKYRIIQDKIYTSDFVKLLMDTKELKNNK